MKTEQEMRESEAPSPTTAEELAEYVNYLVDMQHDYGTCVYAMSLAATAAFNHVASKLGVTGFQAGCAEMDILRRTRSLQGPFLLVEASNALYPQYDLVGKLQEVMKEWSPWLAEQAQKKLDENTADHAHPGVVAHWQELVAQHENQQ